MHDASDAIKPEDSLSSLVSEAFIEPIRSVLIIDDRYPTWETIFGQSGYDPEKRDLWEERENMLAVVSQFRAKSPALIVDIHDGKNNVNIGSYLHQSDLLVLDFQLEPLEPYGVRAAEILRSLLSNSHFNLVVLHTANDDLIDLSTGFFFRSCHPSQTPQNAWYMPKRSLRKPRTVVQKTYRRV